MVQQQQSTLLCLHRSPHPRSEATRIPSAPASASPFECRRVLPLHITHSLAQRLPLRHQLQLRASLLQRLPHERYSKQHLTRVAEKGGTARAEI